MITMKRLKDVTVGVVLGGVLFSGVSYAASTAAKIDVNFLPLKYYFDGVEKKAPEEQKGFIYQGTTYVPLRFVAESLGQKVGYDGPTTSIYVGKQKEGTVTYMGEMKTHTADGERVYTIDSFESNIGEKFVNGYHLAPRMSSGVWSGSMEYEYLTDGLYTKFEAVAAPEKAWAGLKKKDSIGRVKVYADDNLVYDSGGIASDITKSVKVEANLKGALRVKVVIEGAIDLGLLDAKFIN